MSFVRRSYGHYYGYPECCIKAFQKYTKFKDMSIQRQQASEHGFVPCQVCAEKIIRGDVQLHELILPTRQAPHVFGKPKPTKQERLE